MWIVIKEIQGLLDVGARFKSKPAIAKLHPDSFEEITRENDQEWIDGYIKQQKKLES